MKKALIQRLPDKLYLRLMYFYVRKEILKLRKPQQYSQKLQWLKLYGNLENYTNYVDKYAARDYVAKKVGASHLIPLVGVWDKFDDIPLKSLPGKYVMKATHGCGYNIIVTKKSDVQPEQMKRKMDKWLSENYFDVSRETQYKNCQPRIIIEEYIGEPGEDLRDYKFYFFKGQLELIMVASERWTNLSIDVFDADWNRKDIAIDKYPNSSKLPPKPANLKQLIEIAKKLSEDFPFVRVDLYTSKNKIYFGELTFTPSSGFGKFGTKEFEHHLGEKLDLSLYGHLRV